MHVSRCKCMSWGTFTWWIAENFEKSSGGMNQSNKLKFSLILDSCTLLGRTLWPLWIPHLRATCAGDLFSFSATSSNIGSFKISPFTQDPGDPRGEYACKENVHPYASFKFHLIPQIMPIIKLEDCTVNTERWTPVDLHKLWSAVCCQTGWHSTWTTAGGTFEYMSRSCSFLVEKLLTPIARAWPDAYKPSIAVHVSERHNGAMTSGSHPREPGCVRNGQCTCNTQSYSKTISNISSLQFQHSTWFDRPTTIWTIT